MRNHGHPGLLFSLATIAFTTLTFSAQAQVTSAQQSAIKASCRSDFMAKCSGVTPGGKDALACLQKNVEPSAEIAALAPLIFLDLKPRNKSGEPHKVGSRTVEKPIPEPQEMQTTLPYLAALIDKFDYW